MLFKPHECKKHRIFLVRGIFVLEPELELAENTVLFDQSFVYTFSIIHNIFLIKTFDNYNMLNVQ